MCCGALSQQQLLLICQQFVYKYDKFTGCTPSTQPLSTCSCCCMYFTISNLFRRLNSCSWTTGMALQQHRTFCRPVLQLLNHSSDKYSPCFT